MQTLILTGSSMAPLAALGGLCLLAFYAVFFKKPVDSVSNRKYKGHRYKEAE